MTTTKKGSEKGKLVEPGRVLASPFSKRRCCGRNVSSGLTYALPKPPGMKGHVAHICPRGQNLTRYNTFQTGRPREILGKGPFQHAGRLTVTYLTLMSKLTGGGQRPPGAV